MSLPTKLSDLSLKGKLLAVVLVITLVTLGAGFSFVLVNDIKTFRKEMVATTELIAGVVGDASVSDLVFQDREESEKTLGLLREIPTVEAAYLYGPSDALFATYGRADGGPPLRPPMTGSAFRMGKLHVSHPIRRAGEKEGTIYLVASTRELEAKIERHLVVLGSVLLVLLILATLAALKLQDLITRPILELTSAVTRISEGHDYGIRVKKTADDEIGILCDGFNEMLGQIQRREEERDRANQRTREKSLFLAHMSHELRTPLNSIIGFSDVLLLRLKEKLEARELKFLGNINSSGQHLLGIINSILDLSKVEAGQMELSVSVFPVHEVVDGVLGVMKGMAAKKSIVVTADVPAGLPTLEADQQKVRQVLYNLLSNAVKFSHEGGTVQLETRVLPYGVSPLQTESIQFAVTDHGIGIDPKNHAVIFQEFRQVDATAGRQFEGTGLGLALTRSFVELHGGVVRVSSALGHGSTFTVVLPLRLPKTAVRLA